MSGDPRHQSPVYENPSADKFGPPPPPPDYNSEGKLRRRLTRVGFALAVYFAAHWLRTASRGSAWLAVLSVIALLASGLVDYVMQNHGDEESDKDPYSPPQHITREG